MGKEEQISRCLVCNVVVDPEVDPSGKYCSTHLISESGTQLSRKAPGSWADVLLAGLKRDGLIPQTPGDSGTRREQDS